MRKILGLLVAVAFVAVAASSAMAITITTSAANGTAWFSAEVAFYQLGEAQFGFSLYRMTAAQPATSDVAAPKIDWAGVSNVVAGGVGTRTSKVYARVENEAYTAKTKVLFYTDNTNVSLSTSQYKYTIDSSTTPWGVGSAHTLNALVEKDGNDLTNTSAGFATLPLAYRLEIADDVDGGSFTVDTFNFSDNENNISGTIGADSGSLFYVTDKQKIANTDPGDPSAAYDEEYATISTPSGMKNWSGYHRADVKDWYLFFASNFENARSGYAYGTDSLTVQLVVEP